MPKLLHISDLHFGPFFLPQVAEALREAISGITYDILVVSGDFTQRAREEQFKQASEFLHSLPDKPMIVTPGNHDVPLYRVWERLTAPYELYRRYISHQLDQTLSAPGVCIVSLNSTAPRRAITNGRIDPWQLDYCQQAFSKADPQDTRIVVVHHHFAGAPDYDRTPAMPRAQQSLERLEQMKVELVLAGHLHRAFVVNSLDIYAGENRERGLVVAHSGTTTSRRGRAREREKNSFNLIDIDDTRLTIEHWMYFSEIESFAPVAHHQFPRGGKPYFDRTGGGCR